jgi:hypothetical protein
MGIALERRDERGNVLRRITDSVGLARALPEFEDADFPYLRLVDPYGYTFFSHYQLIHAVLAEIEALAIHSPADSIQDLVDLARETASEVHTYLVFVGD